MPSFLRAPALGPLLALALVAPRAHAQQAPASKDLVPSPAPLAPPLLEVSTSRGALEQRTPQEDDDEGWTVRCTSPCTVQAQPGSEYRIKGAWNRSSQVFRAGEGGTRTTVTGHVGSKAMLTGGIILVSAGATAALAGGLNAFLLRGSGHDAEGARSTSRAWLPGAIVGLGGLAVAGVGIALLLNGSTRIEFSSSPAAPPTLSLRLTDRVRLTPEGLRF